MINPENIFHFSIERKRSLSASSRNKFLIPAYVCSSSGQTLIVTLLSNLNKWEMATSGISLFKHNTALAKTSKELRPKQIIFQCLLLWSSPKGSSTLVRRVALLVASREE
ncbi:hypothetical protein TNCV_4079851 [Trichonephila clavipes]|nr:hypothetical protein TNCV_4079851 [Trichonephila clavipes]